MLHIRGTFLTPPPVHLSYPTRKDMKTALFILLFLLRNDAADKQKGMNEPGRVSFGWMEQAEAKITTAWCGSAKK
jgi:hypothetical protein